MRISSEHVGTTEVVSSSSLVNFTYILTNGYRYICDLSYRRRGFIAGVFKQEVKGAEVSEWRIAGAPNASPVTVDGVWALNETHRVLIRLPYKREKDIWISCDSTDVALKSTPDHISCGQFLDIVSMTAVHPEGDQTAELSVGKLKTLIYSCKSKGGHLNCR